MDAWIAGARFFQFASAMILFGSSLFFLYGLKQPPYARWPKRLLALAALVAVVAVVLGVALQAISFSGGATGAIDVTVLGPLLFDTDFGAVLIVRLAAAAAAAIAAALFWKVPLGKAALLESVVSGVLVASFAGTGHAGVNDGAAGIIHVAADVAHNAAAGIWIGALVAMAMMVARIGDAQDAAHAEQARHALRRFSDIGVAVVGVLIVSGVVNAWFLIGPDRLSTLLTTTYGRLLLLKLFLFGAMLILAAANRFVLAPMLANRGGTHTAAARGALVPLNLSLLTETILAFVVLMAVSVMGISEPPALSG